jgi:hypothetical protein
MRFEKGNGYGFTSKDPLDPKPLSIKLRPGTREALRSVDGWQELLRDAIDRIIQANTGG